MRFHPILAPEERIDAVRRRPPRPSPLRQLRAGGRAAPSGNAPFPGFPVPGPESHVPRTAAGLLATLLHAVPLALVFYFATVVPEKAPPEPIPLRLLREAPRPADPAPAQRIRAERRSLSLGATARVVTAQLPSPTVVAAAAPAVTAESLEISALSAASAPRQIKRSQLQVETVRPVAIAAQPPPTRFELEEAVAPALRGPLPVAEPAGPSVAPRASSAPGVSPAPTPGTAAQAGAARDSGVLSSRDVFGSADGVPVAQVDTRAGQSRWRGAGGTGTGNGARSAIECDRRPAVQAYQELIQTRLLERWRDSAQSNRRAVAKLSFVLDPAGSLRASSLISAESPELGNSALAALRAAAPFPPMPEAARCLAGDRWTGTFTLHPSRSARP